MHAGWHARCSNLGDPDGAKRDPKKLRRIQMAKKGTVLKKGKKLAGAKTLGGVNTLRGGGPPTA